MRKKEVDQIRAKIHYDRKEGRYADLSNDELSQYYRFALGGYVTRGKFVYADTQSMAKYIDVLLVLEHLTRLKDTEGLPAAQAEYNRIQALGYMYSAVHNGTNVLCTSEGQSYLNRRTRI